MQFSLGIIGLGAIAKAYRKGLEASTNFTLKAVCDLQGENARSYPDYERYPLFHDYLDMVQQVKLDLVIICTPPKTHFEIAKNVMRIGTGVLLEKPAVVHFEDLIHLIDYAKKNQIIFDCILHWQHANETLYLTKTYPNLAKATTVSTRIEDPYTHADQKTIKEEKVPLHGTWLDSGVNALSMMSMFYNLEDFSLVKETMHIDPKSKLPYFSKHAFTHQSQTFEITVDWRHDWSYKCTNICLNNTDIKVIHHLEEVYENDQLVFKGSETGRLESHYENYFQSFYPNKINHDKILSIHKTLLGVNHGNAD